MNPLRDVRAVCFDWGGTLMSERGPEDIPMGNWPEVEAIEGALECLEALAGRLPLAIATNASVSRRPMIELALSRVGFDGYFSHVFCFTELGFRKSQPRFWRAVERGLGVPLENVAMIGDSYEQDAVYPRQFGVQGVWFNHRSSVERGDVRVPVVDELPRFASWVNGAA
ncbi:HAD family hydrolase [Sorangium sp. So ce1024]|uniref:HAD family hydrolase n=1 Tax=Sorangium sp. So ce1024 TaxID=3133327 RepID=UPI003F07FB5D